MSLMGSSSSKIEGLAPSLTEQRRRDFILPGVYKTHAGHIVWVDKIIIELPELTWLKLPLVYQSSEI